MKVGWVPLALLGLLVACSSDTSSGSSSPIVGTWLQVKSEERIGSGDWSVSADADCRTDNTEQYDANGNFTLYDGTNVCGGGNDSIARGKWRLEAGDTKVIFTYDGIPGEYESTVESLTATDFVRTFSTGTTDGKQARYTFKKK
jgi:hypothetical protein